MSSPYMFQGCGPFPVPDAMPTPLYRWAAKSSPRPPLWLWMWLWRWLAPPAPPLWLWLWWKLRYNVYLIHQMKELHCVRAHAQVLHACLCMMLLCAGVRICMDH